MLVNKDLKTTIVHPSKEYLYHKLFYYSVRSMVLNAVKNAILLGKNLAKLLFDHFSLSAKTENIKCMTKV